MTGFLLLGALACGGDPASEGDPPAQLASGTSGGGASPELPASAMDLEQPAMTVGADEEGGSSPASSTTPEDVPPPPVFCDAPAKVLVPTCGGGSCHSNPGATIGDFAVDAQRAYNFVDKVSVRHADCGRIIDSRDYGQSFMLRKVRGEFESPYCGGIMPVGSFVISEEQIDCLASWLQQFQM